MPEENKSEPRDVSRRDFIKSAGVMVGSAAIASTTLLGVVPSETASAQGTSTQVKLEVYDPGGATEVTQLHAPRLSDLNGKTICEISVGGAWQYERTFPQIRELLQKQFPTIKIIPFTEFPIGVDMPDKKTLDLIKEKKCDGAIIGNAG